MIQISAVSVNGSYYALKADGSVWSWSNDYATPSAVIPKNIGMTNMKQIQVIYGGRSDKEFDAQVFGIDTNNKLVCVGNVDLSQASTSAFLNTSNVILGSDSLCSGSATNTQCVGMKPNRLSGDILGLPLFAN